MNKKLLSVHVGLNSNDNIVSIYVAVIVACHDVTFITGFAQPLP